MKYPFEDYETAESFIEAIESNPNGHYPIGTSMFWHSGIHIFCDSQKEFEPLIGGKVVCYRISEDYRHVKLPASLGKEELEGKWSDYKEFYDKKGKIENDCADETYPISDCFILLEHSISINGSDFTFYTLYMNLAPACDNPNYKDLNKDGTIHGHAINPDDKEFFVDEIGSLLPAKDKKQIYFDLVVLSKQSIEDFPPQDGKKAFWGIKENTHFYQQKGREKVMAVKATLPSWAYFTETKYQDGDSVSYKIRINHIHVYLPKNAIDETGKLEQLSEITFADRNQKIFEPSSDLEFICGKVQPILNKLKGRKVIVVDDINKTSDEALYVVDKSKFRYIKLALDEPVTFWTTEPIKINSQYAKGISANQCVEKYEKNPCSFSYIMKDDISDEFKKDVKDISEIAEEGSDGKNYYKVEFGTPQSEEYFVRESDRDDCLASLLDFSKWFYSCKESNTIVCDRTGLIKDIIEKHDTTVRKAMLMMPIIGIWWTGSKLTWKWLKYVYGRLSSKNDSQGGALTKPEIRKAVCRHPIEWDKNQFSKLKENVLGKSVKTRLENEASEIDLWNGGLEKIFSDSPYFYHPIYFINHLEKAGLFEFNPYAGKTIITPKSYIMKKNKNTGIERLVGTPGIKMVVIDNPGFAPLEMKNQDNTEYSYMGKNFASITGGFREDYLDVERGTGNTYRGENRKVFNHEGLDFHGNKNYNVISFISGKVLGWGWYGSYGRTVFIGYNSGVGVYLIAHLAKYNEEILKRGIVNPWDSVGVVGGSGNHSDSAYATHLHLSYYCTTWKNFEIIIQCNDEIKNGKNWVGNKDLRNPFNHKEEY